MRKVDRKIVLDTETTGLSAERGDKIVEIGCVEIRDGLITENYFHSYVNPERDVPNCAAKIHGLTTQLLKNKPVFSDIADSLIDFIKDSTLVIHNAKFDISFLNIEFNRLKKQAINIKNVIDTLYLAKSKLPNSSVSLDALCKRFGISLESRKYHGALLDAKLLARVYLELSYLEQTELFIEYAMNNQDSWDDDSILETNSKVRNYKITEEELKMHQEFLHKIKDPIWANS